MGTCNPQAALSFERGVGSGQGRPPSHLGSGSKGPRSPGPALLIPLDPGHHHMPPLSGNSDQF